MEGNQFPREVSLCLSGGAARGAFHLGVISVLEEHGVEIKAISGSSIGALIGAAIASGRKAKEILEIFKSKEMKRIFKLSLGKGYLFKVDIEADVINALTDRESFEALDIFLDVAIMNVDEARVEYCNSGDGLKEKVLTSCAISPILAPVNIGGTLYADGGIIDNLPVQRLKHLPYKIIGINLFPNDTKRPSSIYAWVKKLIYLMWHSHTLEKKDLCDIYIEDERINELSTLTFKDLDKAYELGRESMEKYFS